MNQIIFTTNSREFISDDRKLVANSLNDINVSQLDNFQMFDRFGNYAIYEKIADGSYEKLDNGSILIKK